MWRIEGICVSVTRGLQGRQRQEFELRLSYSFAIAAFRETRSCTNFFIDFGRAIFMVSMGLPSVKQSLPACQLLSIRRQWRM